MKKIKAVVKKAGKVAAVEFETKRDRTKAKVGRETPGWVRPEDHIAYAALADDAVERLNKRQAMYEDGAPLGVLTMTPEERKEAWVKNPPAPMPRFDAPQRQEDPSTVAFRAELEAKAARETSAKSTSKASREAKTSRTSREGLTSVASVASEYGLIPRLARAALRAAKIAKPPQGWMFAAGSELEKTIRAALASAKDTTTTPRAKGDPRSPRAKKAAKPKVENAVWSGTTKERAKWRKHHEKIRSAASSPEEQPNFKRAISFSGKPSSKQSTPSTKKTKPKGAVSSATKRAKSSPKQSPKKRR